MKELSIEEKAKAYDKALEKAKIWQKHLYDVNDKDYADELNYIFPELKESKDERVRNKLIEFFKGYFPDEEWWGNITQEDIIAYLEKQGEPKEINPSEFDSQLNRLLGQFKSLPKEELASSLNFYLNVVQNDGTYKEENRGEQKPTDKVEPKFHEGEWIVRELDNTCYQIKKCILNVTNNKYGYDLTSGGYISSQDANFYHLWTLQDAKDGDVLHSIGFHNDCIFIFNGLDNWKFDEPNGDRAVATGYCCLFVSADNMEFGIQGPDCVEVNTIKPATKIQRDLLLKKMKEAGYEWDAEKKELKKIEQTPTGKVKPKFEVGDIIRHKEQGFTCKIIAVDTAEYRVSDCSGTHLPFDSQDAYELVEQKPAWSDTDYVMQRAALEILIASPKTVASTILKESVIVWLQSLKNRLQPKLKWSEEDEKMVKKLCDDYDIRRQIGHISQEEHDNILNWLKSLRPQSHWRPSEEQLTQLYYASNGVRYNRAILLSLLEQLRKLREE